MRPKPSWLWAVRPPRGASPEVRAAERALARFQQNELAAIEPEEEALASFGPMSPLFEEVTRARVAWRIASGDRERGAEALALIDRVIAAGAPASDYLLRARAAALAERPDALGAALQHLGQSLRPNAQGRRFARRALMLLQALPDGQEHPMWPRFVQLAR